MKWEDHYSQDKKENIRVIASMSVLILILFSLMIYFYDFSSDKESTPTKAIDSEEEEKLIEEQEAQALEKSKTTYLSFTIEETEKPYIFLYRITNKGDGITDLLFTEDPKYSYTVQDTQGNHIASYSDNSKESEEVIKLGVGGDLTFEVDFSETYKNLQSGNYLLHVTDSIKGFEGNIVSTTFTVNKEGSQANQRSKVVGVVELIEPEYVEVKSDDGVTNIYYLTDEKLDKNVLTEIEEDDTIHITYSIEGNNRIVETLQVVEGSK